MQNTRSARNLAGVQKT